MTPTNSVHSTLEKQGNIVRLSVTLPTGNPKLEKMISRLLYGFAIGQIEATAGCQNLPTEIHTDKWFTENVTESVRAAEAA
jgi:hypothetical protein